MNSNIWWLLAFLAVLIIVGVGIYLYYKHKNSTTSAIFSNGFPHGFAMGNRKIVMWDPSAEPPINMSRQGYFSERK